MSQNGLQETFQSSLRPEGTMDLFIETLTGTAFEMTVSPFDTIMSIKSKIQRVEGIPVSHQHLLYNLQELDDSSSLIDHSIQNGATLKLVLSMRGGPISTRRVHTGEEFTWKELREFMENGRDDVLDYIPPGCRVTVLVFRDGDQVNLFRVLENEDGTYSPLSESLSGSSIQSLFAEDDPEESAKRLQENSVTMCKMQELRTRMEALALRRKPKRSAPRVVSARRPSLLHSRRGGGGGGGGGVAVRTAAAAAAPPHSSSSSPPDASASALLHLPPLRKAHAPKPPPPPPPLLSRGGGGGYLSTSSFLTQGAGPRRSSREAAAVAAGATAAALGAAAAAAGEATGATTTTRQQPPPPPSSSLLLLPRLQGQPPQLQPPPPRRLHSLHHHHHPHPHHHASSTSSSSSSTTVNIAPKRPAARRRSRLTTSQVLDAKPSDCLEFGGGATIAPAASSSSQATAATALEPLPLPLPLPLPAPSSSSSPPPPPSSTSKIAIVEGPEPEGEEHVADDHRHLAIALPLCPSTSGGGEAGALGGGGGAVGAAAAAFALSSITRERVTTSVGGGGSGGRYRVSRFVLEEEDRPKTSPDKLTQQQKRAQEICDLLTETKWHSRRHRVNCSSVEELSSDATREKGTASRLNSRRESEILAPEQSLHFRHPILNLPLVRAPRAQRYDQRSHQPTSREKPISPKLETELGIFGQRGSRRRVPSGQLLPSALKNPSTLLPMIGAATSSKSTDVSGKKAVRHRCAQCRKRLNITNMYTCRCEKLFCSAHRYSELHECTFDYKSEGRKLIEQANPLVTAPKLPKI